MYVCLRGDHRPRQVQVVWTSRWFIVSTVDPSVTTGVIPLRLLPKIHNQLLGLLACSESVRFSSSSQLAPILTGDQAHGEVASKLYSGCAGGRRRRAVLCSRTGGRCGSSAHSRIFRYELILKYRTTHVFMDCRQLECVTFCREKQRQEESPSSPSTGLCRQRAAMFLC